MILTACSAFHSKQYEMDQLAESVFHEGKGDGIDIIVKPIGPNEKN
jgi:hypothetical protein